MNKNIRIIPRLDIKGPNVVKGIHLEGLRIVGRPELFAAKYYEQGADELLFVDTVASLYQRNNLADIIERTAKEIFIPLTVGGGIRSVEDMRKILRAGADKVAINTAAIANPELISQGADAFGAQCIVLSIQSKKTSDGNYVCMVENGREHTGLDVFEWAERAVELGAGEILITSIDQDGTGKGYDLDLTKALAGKLAVPVIPSGGAGKVDDVKRVITEGHADAVCIASIFHYGLLKFMETANYAEEGNVDFLKKTNTIQGHLNHTRAGIDPTTVEKLKEYLLTSGINCRVENSNGFGKAA